MSYELYFTSAPKGLRPGTSGFCTVAATRDLPAPLWEKVEALSGYRHLFSPLDSNNPVVYSYVRIDVLGKAFHVLSRICAAGLDYSGRGNKFAHHVILEPEELPPGGPAWLLGEPGFMETQWEGTVGYLAGGRKLPLGEAPPGPCRAWENLTGDAGWAGMLLQTTFKRSGQPVYCVYPPGGDLLPLIAEAIGLLPPDRRWQISFSTYFLGIAPGISCLWRGIPDGTADAEKVRRQNPAAVFDLSRLRGVAPESVFADQARTGTRPVVASVGGPEMQREHENAVLLVGQALEGFPAYPFADEQDHASRDRQPAPIFSSRMNQLPSVPPPVHTGQAATPPVPPGLPPQPSGHRATGGLRWHLPSLALGSLCGCLLGLGAVSVFWWSYSRHDFDSTQVGAQEGGLARASGKENADLEVVANENANRLNRSSAEQDIKLQEMTKQKDKLQSELTLIQQQNQAKEETIKGLKASLSKLENQVTHLQEEIKKSRVGREALPDGKPPGALAVDGFIPVDPAQERGEAVKLELKGLPPETNLSLLCQKQLGRAVRFDGQQRRERKDKEEWPILNIGANGQFDDLAQFAVVEGQLTFSWMEREKNTPLRRIFIDSCLLQVANDKQGRKVFALAAPAYETKLKLAEEQGVFTLRPERLANWHGPDLFLDQGEFADRSQLKRISGGHPRLLESDEYAVILRQGPSSSIEIWPRRKTTDKPLLRKIVVYTTIKDYRVDVYRLNVSN